MPKFWSHLDRHDLGFVILYPTDSEVLTVPGEIAIIPNWARPFWDPKFLRNAGSPSISIVKTGCKNPDENMVINFMKYQPDGYKNYKMGKRHPVIVAGARYLTAYEFQFALGDTRFNALSLLVQRELKLFNVTAAAEVNDFKTQRTVIERIVFSFQLI
jgi:hypothetical protein